MNVRLAAREFSSVSKVLLACNPTEAAETACFCSLMGWLFGIINIQNNHSLEFERKPMLAPFGSVNDWKVLWFRKVLLKSLHDWLNSVHQCRQAKETLQKMLARKCLYRKQ